MQRGVRGDFCRVDESPKFHLLGVAMPCLLRAGSPRPYRSSDSYHDSRTRAKHEKAPLPREWRRCRFDPFCARAGSGALPLCRPPDPIRAITRIWGLMTPGLKIMDGPLRARMPAVISFGKHPPRRRRRTRIKVVPNFIKGAAHIRWILLMLTCITPLSRLESVVYAAGTSLRVRTPACRSSSGLPSRP